MNWRTLATSAVLLAAVSVTPARATAPVIDWDPAYAWQLGATPTNMPALGEFKMVGTISMFGPPLGFLDATDPTVEYTFYIHNLISNGTTFVGPLGTRLFTTTFTGGQIEVYFDTSPDASFDPNPPNAGVPGDFTDGGLPILTGLFTSFTVQSNDFTAFNTGNIEGSILWTGGTRFADLANGSAEPCPGLLTGGSTWFPGVMFPGYLFRHDGKIDQQCPVPVTPTTWGRIKSIYR